MRLLIVDDHEAVRRGVRSLLSESGWDVCGEAVDGQDALDKARELKPDLIVMDVSMPRLTGLEATRQVRSILPECEVLILSQHENSEMAREALKAGARGYVAKGSIPTDLISAVEKASRHEYFFAPAILDHAPSGRTGVQEILQPRAASEQSRAQIEAEANALSKLNACSSRLWQMRRLHDGLEEMLHAAVELLGADKGNVQIFNSERGVLTIEAQRGFQQDFLEFFREVSAQHDTACGRALRTGEQIVIDDVERDAAYAPFRDIARAAGYRAVVSAPLVGKNGDPLGILSTHFGSPHRPSDEELRMLDLYVRQAADFIERHRIEESLRELSQHLDREVRARTRELENTNDDLLRQTEQIRELSRRLMETQDEERRHIARELHDSAGQTLAVIGMSLGQSIREAERVAPTVAKKLKEVESLVRQSHKEIRTTSYLLHPPLLDESGLSSALNVYVEGFGERSGIAITLDVPENLGRLPSDMELAIFRLAQECLTNIHRHSGSTTASIRLLREDGRVQVEVTDQGKGIPADRLAEIKAGRSGVGIRGMQERLRQFGAEMAIEATDSGTRVVARIPAPNETAAPQGQHQAAV